MLSPDPKLEQATRRFIEQVHGELVRLTFEATLLRSDRDDARRAVCAFVASERSMIAGKVIGAEEVAKEMGWDCFKENDND